MNTTQQQRAARDFAARWQGKGYEKGESQSFWLSLLSEVFGIEHPDEWITFEKQVHLDHTSFIDAFIPRTHVMIEQKSIDKDLGAPIRQSDGSLLNPFQQAKRYIVELKRSEHPRWVVTCNFREFWVYDMEQPNGEPQKILLKDLEKDYYRLQFLVDEGNEHLKREMEVSVKAGELVGIIYDKLLEQYGDAGVNSGERFLSFADSAYSPFATTTAGKTPAHQADILRSLNILCVRLVFCLYAEDAGLFPTRTYFHDYLARYDARDIRRALIDLFQVLDTPLDERDPYLEDDIAAFPYVNGGLFSEEKIIIPRFTDELKQLILQNASADFDWSEISPTIFGAVFESTLNPETRRSGGMHYTSIENIHKVIDPLFLNDLRAEFESIVGAQAASLRQNRTQAECVPPRALSQQKRQQLQAFQDKLASLTFFDPACGSGNFLTETFLSLRRLENEVIQAMYGDTRQLGFEGTIKVNISQFYGIEINDFACTVAKTALWIAESQTLKETSSIVGVNLNFLPLKTNAYIHEGNALRTDWAGLFVGAQAARLQTNDSTQTFHLQDSNAFEPNALPDAREPRALWHYPDFIIGNPPFVGARWMSKEQKQDVSDIFGAKWKNAGNLDYVTCWYKKAIELMKMSDKNIYAAFVSTNSITQGEQVANLWKPLFEEYGVQIDFAYRTFRWDSEADIKAHVHCVIVGFSVGAQAARLQTNDSTQTSHLQDSNAFEPNALLDAREPRALRQIFLNDNQVIEAKNINGYLLDAPNVWIESRNKPLCDVPTIGIGNKPIDDGNYLFSAEEMEEFIKKEPNAIKYFHPFYGAYEFINRKPRYCLYLGNCTPAELRSMPYCLERVKNVREFRLSSKSEGTRKIADTPTHFHVENMPQGSYIVIPQVSSERRRYIPMGYMDNGVLCSDKVRIMPDGTLYHFGILESNVHMAWMRVVCGRLKSDYSYSINIVYNNFPWCNPTDEQRARIERTAQAILDARALYPDSSLADLYDETTMPIELRRAHQENDKAVMQAYGFKIGMSESDCVAELFKMYQQLTK